MTEPDHSSTVAGWREWVSLPGLGVDWIKVKLDTGARSSAIHAFDLEERYDGDAHLVRFSIHPWQRSEEDAVVVEAPVLEKRAVRSSNGQSEDRLVVPLTVRLMGQEIVTDVTLSNRDEMGFRMLIGRSALEQGILVDSARSYLGPRPPRSTRRKNWGR